MTVSRLLGASILVALLSTSQAASKCGAGGILYPDSDDCECFACFSGPTCETQAGPSDCALVAGRGDPSGLFDYWDMRTARFPSEAVQIPSNYRPSYGLDAAYLASKPLTGTGKRLVPALHALHKLAGNAVTANKSVVFGAGATQIVNAACYAYAKKAGKPLAMLTSIPHWFHYRDWAGFNPALTFWNESLAREAREGAPISIDASSAIEFVNHPNNPTGGDRRPFFPSGPHLAMDLVYYWPGFTQVTRAFDEDLMMFSMSKSTGHAGTRFGWAWVADEQIATDMAFFIDMQSRRVSVDAQFRSLHLVDVILKSDGELFRFVETQMTARWQQIRAWFAKPRVQRFMRLANEEDGFFLWIDCLAPAMGGGVDSCAGFWKQAFNVVGTDGRRLGGKAAQLRINAMAREIEFKQMMKRMVAWADASAEEAAAALEA